jgi:hypothetical protein
MNRVPSDIYQIKNPRFSTKQETIKDSSNMVLVGGNISSISNKDLGV